MSPAVGGALHDAAPALLQLYAASVIVLAVAVGAARLLRGASAAVRHLVWASAISALLVLPVATLVMPDVPVRVLSPASSGPGIAPVERPVASIAAERSRDLATREAAAPVTNRAAEPMFSPAAVPVGEPHSLVAPPAWSWRARAVAGWASVSILLLLSAALSHIRLRRLASSARRVTDRATVRAAERLRQMLGIRQAVALVTTPHAGLPLTWGIRAPLILLPARGARWTPERRDAVLAHELAHVARGDALGHEMARFAAALYWINPLVWVALRAIRAERERACDDLVLATGARASSYAGDLLEIARTSFARRPAAAAALAMARPSELEGRLLAILDPRVPRRPASRVARRAAATLALALVLPLGALRPAERAQAADASTDGPAAIHAPDDATPGDAIARIEGVARPVEAEGGTDRSAPDGVARGDAVDAARRSMLDAPMLRVTPATSPLPVEASPSLVPPATLAASGPASVQDTDLETLLAVARAAGSLSSDHDKSELLLAVIERAPRDAGLQRTLLASAATIRSAHQRHRVLVKMLTRNLVAGTESAFLETTAGIASAHDRSVVLVAFARSHGAGNEAVRGAYLAAASSMASGHARVQALAAIVDAPDFGAAAALDVIPALRGLPSRESANLLVTIARSGLRDDAAVREAIVQAAGALPSASDYKRVVEAAGIGASVPR